MRFALMTEPQQGLTYEEILAAARTAEEAGIEAFFRSDHYSSFPGGAGLPTTDAWTTIAGLARETSKIHLGALVSPVTFRIPGSFAKVIQTADEMSGGRIEAGFGAGWNDEEHAQHGIPFPPIDERYEMLEEELAIIHGLWTEPDGWSYSGRHWQVRGARRHGEIGRGGRRHPHILIGGAGKRRLAALVARYADEFNLNSASPDAAAAAYERIRAACREVGRDPDQLVYSAMTGVLVGETAAELRDRISQLLELMGTKEDAGEWLAARRTRWVMGTPDEAWERVRSMETAGAQRIMLQDFLPRDLDQIRLIGQIFG
jgi:F420-dependent oxidoreductase-like protein